MGKVLKFFQGEGNFQERSHRIQVVAGRDVTFDLIKPFPTAGLAIQNLSESGMAINLPQADHPIRTIPNGSTLQGELSIEGRKYPLTMNKVRQDTQVVGVSFESELGTIKALIQAYFANEMKAIQLQCTEDSQHLSDDGAHHLSGVKCELTYELQQGKLYFLKLHLLGLVVQAFAEQQTLVGHITEYGDYFPVRSEHNSLYLGLANSFLSNIPQLDPKLKKAMGELLAPIKREKSA